MPVEHWSCELPYPYLKLLTRLPISYKLSINLSNRKKLKIYHMHHSEQEHTKLMTQDTIHQNYKSPNKKLEFNEPGKFKSRDKKGCFRLRKYSKLPHCDIHKCSRNWKYYFQGKNGGARRVGQSHCDKEKRQLVHDSPFLNQTSIKKSCMDCINILKILVVQFYPVLNKIYWDPFQKNLIMLSLRTPPIFCQLLEFFKIMRAYEMIKIIRIGPWIHMSNMT